MLNEPKDRMGLVIPNEPSALAPFVPHDLVYQTRDIVLGSLFQVLKSEPPDVDLPNA